MLCHSAKTICEKAPSFNTCRDIIEDELIGSVIGVERGKLHRVRNIIQPFKIHTFDNSSVSHVKAGDNSFFQHASASFSASGRDTFPL